MFKPLYWLNVNKTQDILAKKSMEGKKLSKMNFKLGIFKFEDCQPNERTYLIRRSKKCNGKAPRKLLDSGWTNVCGNKNNYVAYYEGKSDEEPSYDGYLTALSIRKIVLLSIVLYAVGFFCGVTIALFDRMSRSPDDEKYVSSVTKFISEGKMAMLFGIHIGLIISGILLLIMLSKSSKRYSKILDNTCEMNFTVPVENFKYTKEEEKKLIKEKKMLAVRKMGWFYSPDKGEAYIEKMERQGWNFYRFDKLGTVFYFIKGEPRNVKFVVDYQDNITDDYLQMCKDSGWLLQFKSISKVGGYIMWLKAYENDEETPKFYSESSTILNHMKKLAFIYSICYGTNMLLFATFVFNYITGMSSMPSALSVAIIVSFSIVIVEFGFLSFLSVKSYLRIKKKLSGNSVSAS